MKIIKKIISLLILLSMLVTLCSAMIEEVKAATVEKEKTINILFIGNSKTYFNNMPAILNNMLYKSGKTANYKVLVKGSSSLNFHYHYIKDHPEQLKKLFKNEKIDALTDTPIYQTSLTTTINLKKNSEEEIRNYYSSLLSLLVNLNLFTSSLIISLIFIFSSFISFFGS